jgi:hypothetical protein
MAQFGTNIEEDLQLIDIKVKQLRNEYEQYFLGTRKREPSLLRGEVTKMVNYYCNVPIQNTGFRFRFNNLRSRFFTFRRYWDDTLRKIEEGRYERHVFRANLRDRERERAQPRRAAASGSASPGEKTDLFESYLEARQACGQGAEGVTREKLQALLAKQEKEIRQRFGVSKVNFRVVVEGGRAKLKASPVRT